MEYLDFEKPIKNLYEDYNNFLLKKEKNEEYNKDKFIKIKLKLEKTIKDVYKNLTPWQRIQLSRHPNRPYSMDYIKNITKNCFIELHGDRNFSDDKALVGGFGKINKTTFMFIGTQKGKNTKERQYRRFGMPNPEGYRKALRLMKLAEKFNKPIVTLIDTPGAYPGLEAEERGQGEAIGRNIYEMMCLKVPIITIIIGEASSGGALGIGIGNTVYMMENTWYSVISPESCSSILWKNWNFKEKAAKSLKLTANDMLNLKLIDGIIKEPLGGAHFFHKKAFEFIKSHIINVYQEFSGLDSSYIIKKRQEKYINMGVFEYIKNY